jgi:hypothetical protein
MSPIPVIVVFNIHNLEFDVWRDIVTWHFTLIDADYLTQRNLLSKLYSPYSRSSIDIKHTRAIELNWRTIKLFTKYLAKEFMV